MTQCIIFDLSEVLIAGLVGIEKQLSRMLPLPEDSVLPCFAGPLRDELFIGNISEEAYLKQIIAREGWSIDIPGLKQVIRDNFHHEVDGSQAVLMNLATRYEVVLLSDHAREWIAYIQSVHPFLKVFQRTFFSYELKSLKQDPATFSYVLDVMGVAPHDCLLIDDNQDNIRSAKSVGLQGIHFVNARHLAETLDAIQI